jgi:hypothetical protein
MQVEYHPNDINSRLVTLLLNSFMLLNKSLIFCSYCGVGYFMTLSVFGLYSVKWRDHWWTGKDAEFHILHSSDYCHSFGLGFCKHCNLTSFLLSGNSKHSLLNKGYVALTCNNLDSLYSLYFPKTYWCTLPSVFQSCKSDTDNSIKLYEQFGYTTFK